MFHKLKKKLVKYSIQRNGSFWPLTIKTTTLPPPTFHSIHINLLNGYKRIVGLSHRLEPKVQKGEISCQVRTLKKCHKKGEISLEKSEFFSS
jgi:hypothetical protein